MSRKRQSDTEDVADVETPGRDSEDRMFLGQDYYELQGRASMALEAVKLNVISPEEAALTVRAVLAGGA